MANDDIRDLIGRYATGSLSSEERKRLFDAALDDQELFDELAREQELKQVIDEPGVRNRLIRALEPPKRRVPWILAVVPLAALSALLIVFLMWPAPKPSQQVAVAKIPAPAVAPSEVAPPEAARKETVFKDAPTTEPEPTGVPTPAKAKTAAGRVEPIVDQPSQEVEKREAAKKDAENKTADQKERDQLAAAAPAPPPPAARAMRALPPANQLAGGQQQNSPGGPKQNFSQQRVEVTAASNLVLKAPDFGFHYSLETKGHLIIVPAADGYLSVKSNDGAILYNPKRTAAGIIVDITLPDAARSVSIAFSANASPVQSTPIVRTDPSGTVQGTDLAITLRINP
jgi:hypothetical protein